MEEDQSLVEKHELSKVQKKKHSQKNKKTCISYCIYKKSPTFAPALQK